MDETCDALSQLTLRGWTGRKGKHAGKPIDVDALVRCVRKAGHEGEHRSARALRKWTNPYTAGWIDLKGDD